MKKRGKIGQAKHDAKVSLELKKLINEGFRVWADLPDRTKPPKVGGVIPDIYAKKGNKLIVEEIETLSTKKSDKLQQQKLERGTKKLGGKFKIKIAK